MDGGAFLGKRVLRTRVCSLAPSASKVDESILRPFESKHERRHTGSTNMERSPGKTRAGEGGVDRRDRVVCRCFGCCADGLAVAVSGLRVRDSRCFGGLLTAGEVPHRPGRGVEPMRIRVHFNRLAGCETCSGRPGWSKTVAPRDPDSAGSFSGSLSPGRRKLAGNRASRLVLEI